MPGITTSWRLYISSWNKPIYSPGDATIGNRPSDATDITDRLIGAEVEMSVGIGEVPRGIGTFVLDNNDGLYTPGTATYNISEEYDAEVEYNNGLSEEHSWEWFRQPVFLVPLMNGAEVNPSTGAGWFSGFCTGVELEDDGFNSTITLTVEDWFTFAGRYTFTQDNLDAIDALRAGGRSFSIVPNFVWEYVLTSVPSPGIDTDVLDLNVSFYN